MSVFFISSLPGKALRTLVDIVRLAEIKRILGECLLISSLLGKALRTLIDMGDSEDTNLVFNFSVYPLFHSSN